MIGIYGIPVMLILLLLISCGGSSKFITPEPPPGDRQPVPKPQAREVNLASDNVDKLFTYQIKRFLDLSRYFRMISGDPKEAMNTDAFDEVYNSSWFTNRNGITRMSPEVIARGPDQGNGPDISGEWTVVRAKAQGVTPGFSIKDRHGNIYVIKFDPAGYPELATGAEVVSTKLFYAIGYNVPENYLVYFHPKILRLGEEVSFSDVKGHKRFMNQEDLDAILAHIQNQPDGRIRAVASKYLSGKPIGPFKYEGVRKDDANDFVPHEHRRELRGLRVIAAWLNHFDTKAGNSLDMYLPEEYVRHYLIDFGSTLGSQGDEPMPPEMGHEGVGDPDKVLKTIGSLGTYKRHWEREPEIRFPSIGYFISTDFNPDKYRYILPNPAFNNATDRDKYWGAKLVMSFSDEQIRTAVEQGKYSDPDAAEYLIGTLIERRDIVGRHFFSRVPPIDGFEIRDTAEGEQELYFKDLAVETGLVSADSSYYEYELQQGENILLKNRLLDPQNFIPLSEWKSLFRNPKVSQWELKIRLRRGKNGEWSGWVSIFLELVPETGKYRLIGIAR
jgi:hypothetical protein